MTSQKRLRVQTSASGRRFVDIREVIRGHLARIADAKGAPTMKDYKEHLYERLQTIEDITGYLSAALDEGPDTLSLAVKDVINANKLKEKTPTSQDEGRTGQ